MADSPAVVDFIALFHELKDCIDDDPADLVALASDDEGILKICQDLHRAAQLVFQGNRAGRYLYTGAVDLSFVRTSRDYENRYAVRVRSIANTSFRDGSGKLALPKAAPPLQDFELADFHGRLREEAMKNAISVRRLREQEQEVAERGF